MSTKSSIWAVVMRGMPKASCMGAMPRPRPRVKRPPVRLCMVRAMPAVTMGWRVLWLVAAVEMAMRSLTAPAAPHNVVASFLLYRSEMKHRPRPMSSASTTSPTSSRDDCGWPASV